MALDVTSEESNISLHMTDRGDQSSLLHPTVVLMGYPGRCLLNPSVWFDSELQMRRS